MVFIDENNLGTLKKIFHNACDDNLERPGIVSIIGKLNYQQKFYELVQKYKNNQKLLEKSALNSIVLRLILQRGYLDTQIINIGKLLDRDTRTNSLVNLHNNIVASLKGCKDYLPKDSFKYQLIEKFDEMKKVYKKLKPYRDKIFAHNEGLEQVTNNKLEAIEENLNAINKYWVFLKKSLNSCTDYQPGYGFENELQEMSKPLFPNIEELYE